MFAVFLDGKNTCRIVKGNVSLVFQNIAQKSKILILSVLVVFVHTENAVPLVD